MANDDEVDGLAISPTADDANASRVSKSPPDGHAPTRAALRRESLFHRPARVYQSAPSRVARSLEDEPCVVSGLRWDRWCSSSSRQGRLRALFRGGSRAGASARRSSASSLCDGLAPPSSCWGCCHSSVHLRVSPGTGLAHPHRSHHLRISW